MTTKVGFKPLGNRVVVEPMEGDEQVSAGGIYIPDTAKEKPQMGQIVAAGPGKTSDNGNTVEMTLKAGDKVLYGKYSGTEITLNDNEVLIMRESDILAKF